MVTFNQPQLEQEAIKSVEEHTEFPHKLTVYDNWEKKEWIGKVWNDLIRKSDCEYICLLNSDVVVEDGWLTDLMETFDWDKDIAIVGPSTNSCGSEQKVPRKYAKENRGKWMDGSLLSGFCLLFKKEVWDLVNGFDEDFELYGQDSFFVWMVQRGGYKTVWNKGAWVFHHGRSSILKAEKNGLYNTDEQSRKAQEIFDSKVQDCINRSS